MNPEVFTFKWVGLAILKMFFIILAGYVLFSRTLLRREAITALASLLISILFPALIFHKITTTFQPQELAYWWLFPFYSVLMSSLGLGMGWFATKWLKGFGAGRELMACCAFQNGAYLPMTLVAFLMEGPEADQLLVYTFLFMMGFNLTIWSFLPPFLARKQGGELKWETFLNGPVLAVVLSVGSVFIFGKGWVPELVDEPIKMLGDAAFPLSLLILGGLLAAHQGVYSKDRLALASGVMIKLVFMPLIVLGILFLLPFDERHRFVIFLQALVPTAITLVVIGEEEKADNQFISAMILYSNLVSIVTIPIGFMLYGKIFS